MSEPDDCSADHDAVIRTLAGDPSAFGDIVRHWQSPLINLAYRFFQDRGRSEDMAQEAFLRAFRNLSSWRRESAFSTWLFALATNLYCTELRRHPSITLPFDEIHQPAATSLALDEHLNQRNQQAILHQAVQTLPPRYREVVILYYFHEMDVPATARSLALPEGTVKAHLFRARKLLRAKLTVASSLHHSTPRPKELA